MDISKDGSKLFGRGFSDNNNDIMVSYDNGATWDIYATVTPVSGYEYSVLQYVMDYDDENDCLYVSRHGYVQKYKDGEFVESLENAMKKTAPDFWCWAFAIDPNDSNVLYAAGSSSIVVDKFRVNGNEFTAEGRVLSSGGVGIKGRTVKLSAKAPNGSAYEVWAEGVSADSGAFILTYTFDNQAESGKYEGKIESKV